MSAINRTKRTKKNVKAARGGNGVRAVVAFVCIGMLAVGFFFAARQHFHSMDYGMRNSRLRKQVDQLEAEKRRLILARESSLAASEIKKAAKRAGLLGGSAARAEREAEPKLAAAKPAEKPLVVKTAAVSSSAPVVTTALQKGVEKKRNKEQARTQASE